jgi:DNA-binding MarR family transcriptional regulator
VQPELVQLREYLHTTLGVAVAAQPWRNPGSLPHFLKERYTFAEMDLMGVHTVLMMDRDAAEESPAIVRKHMELLRAKAGADPIYVRRQITPYNRKRLIEHKVPFIVPGNQLYLPMLAIDLREHFRRIRTEPPVLSPATQALFLHSLLRETDNELSPADMAKRLGYSAMTMTRAFDELEAAQLGNVTTRGRERALQLAGNRRELWTRALPLLRTPVAERRLLERGAAVPDALRSGLTALAEYSMLAPPEQATYALGREQWGAWRQEQAPVEVSAHDPTAQAIEVWRYPPGLLATRNLVDPLSLYLSLKDDTDERVQSSLEEMMRTLPW